MGNCRIKNFNDPACFPYNFSAMDLNKKRSELEKAGYKVTVTLFEDSKKKIYVMVGRKNDRSKHLMFDINENKL